MIGERLGHEAAQANFNSLAVSVVDAKSEASGTMTANANGAAITIPANMIGPNQSIIRSDVSYTYNVPVAYLLPSAFTYNDTFYLRPRIIDPIPRITP